MIKVRGALRLIKGKVGHCLLMMEWGGWRGETDSITY